MKNNTVVFYNDDIATVKKNGCPEVMVAKSDNMVTISQPSTQAPDGGPFIALVKCKEDSSAAYTEWLYLIGKMCKKEPDSKYFKNPKFEEHLINGDADTSSKKATAMAIVSFSAGYVAASKPSCIIEDAI